MPTIAVAGAGLIGRRHIEEIQHHPDCQLLAIVDPAPGAVPLADACGVPCVPDLETLFTQMQPDGVILATPNALHVSQARQCIDAGVAVLVEKPLGDRLAEAEQLVARVEATGARLLVGHHRRHSAILREATQVVRSGVLGALVGVMGSAVFHKPDHGYFDPPHEWRKLPGGGPMLLNMIHEVDNLRALVGEIIAVQAMASSATRGFAVEDTVAINLQFANGALGTFLLSDTAASPRSWEQTSGENLAYAHYPDEDCYAILGTQGSLGVPTLTLRRYGANTEASWYQAFETQRLPLERVDPLAQQIAHFAAVIRKEQSPLVTARDGLQNLRVTEAIRQAASHGGRVVVAQD